MTIPFNLIIITVYLDNLHKQGNAVIMVHVIELPDMAHSRKYSITMSTKVKIKNDHNRICSRFCFSILDNMEWHLCKLTYIWV